MGIFDVCRAYDEPKMVKALGLYPFFRRISESEGPRVVIDGRSVIMTGSNNYLGLTHHPKVKEAAREAIERYGTGCTGSRFLNGNLDIHEELEARLAAFLGKEAALVFSSGFLANLGALSTLASGTSVRVFSDADNHASLIEGLRLARPQKVVYAHNDMEDLARHLEERAACPDDLVVTDGVFSMTGAIVDLAGLVALKERYGFAIYLDDAHGVGVLGRQGRGTADHLGLSEKVDLIFGTFSKSFASIGGFVAGDADVIDYLRHKARSLIFSAALPPSAVMAALAALEVMETDSGIFDRLWRNVAMMRDGFARLGYCTLGSKTPIIPIFVGSESLAFRMCRDLFDLGVFATPVIFPAVPYGRALIRTSYMASHDPEDLASVLASFAELKGRYRIPDYDAGNLPRADHFDFSYLAAAS